jgi:hypothetical protein
MFEGTCLSAPAAPEAQTDDVTDELLVMPTVRRHQGCNKLGCVAKAQQWLRMGTVVAANQHTQACLFTASAEAKSPACRMYIRARSGEMRHYIPRHWRRIQHVGSSHPVFPWGFGRKENGAVYSAGAS